MTEHRRDRLAGLLSLIAVLLALLGGFLAGRQATPAVRVIVPHAAIPRPLSEGAGLIGCGSWPFPPGHIFGLFGIRGCYQSPFSYEASLLDGAAPTTDSDYLLPFAANQPLRLPGTRWDRYRYRGAEYIQGSGWAAKYRTPNGGRFALLHLSSIVGPTLLPPLGAIKQPAPFDAGGVDQTAVVLGFQPLSGSAPVRVGGSRAGWSGWPLWGQYANGSPGPSNAHLCLVADARAIDWFWRVAHGRDYRRQPFAYVRAWYRRVDRHHQPRSTVPSPWSGRLLTQVARAWEQRRWLHGVRSRTRWGPGHSYNQTHFACGTLYVWARFHAAKGVRHTCS